MAVSEAEKCANVAAQLVSKKARTRSVDPHGPSTKGGGGSEVSKDLMKKRDVLLISSVRMQKKKKIVLFLWYEFFFLSCKNYFLFLSN